MNALKTFQQFLMQKTQHTVKWKMNQSSNGTNTHAFGQYTSLSLSPSVCVCECVYMQRAYTTNKNNSIFQYCYASFILEWYFHEHSQSEQICSSFFLVVIIVVWSLIERERKKKRTIWYGNEMFILLLRVY